MWNEDEWDEEDEHLMEYVSIRLDSHIESVFNLPSDQVVMFHKPVTQISPSKLQKFTDLVARNLNELYIKHQGKNWKVEKVEEMKEVGLVYVWYENKSNHELIGFISFKVCFDDGFKVLYLYEIQINEEYHHQRYGSNLIENLQSLAKHVSRSIINDDNGYFDNARGISLTVFPDNLEALNWYFKIGYNYTSQSPRDRKLRNGKLVKPKYYVLHRPSV
ncbi:histone-specific N-acetyltransferase NAT4 [Scheffersomyces amazonensis]|uniref:histone-specific N-acetyltransferase NAT4 n=1 Tax=Scheffersomyces amazonensis TaxID=1078765 RepID=UPI00315DCB2A